MTQVTVLSCFVNVTQSALIRLILINCGEMKFETL